MPGRADLDLYNLLLGFGWVRERAELVRATVDPGFLLRARRALFPSPASTGARSLRRMCCRLSATVRSSR